MKCRDFACHVLVIIFLLSACHAPQKTQKNYDTIIDYSDTAASNSSSSELHFSDIALSGDSSGWEIRNKYAQIVGIAPNEIHNIKLYKFIDEWLGTKYLWGGSTKRGIDCSAFVQKLYANVYNINIPRTSIEQFFTQDVEPFASTKYLSEGDMVFFKTMKGNIVTHVGFYLGNNKFVNASSHGGVSIGSLKDRYWKSRYVVAGRIKNEKQRKLD